MRNSQQYTTNQTHVYIYIAHVPIIIICEHFSIEAQEHYADSPAEPLTINGGFDVVVTTDE